MATIIVSGALANKPRSGGEAWVRMSWVRGLRRLGFDVCFAEQISADTCVDAHGDPASFELSINRCHFEETLAALAPDCPAALVLDDGPVTAGIGLDELVDCASGAALLVNISGHLALDAVKSAPDRAAYVDIDPGFTQIWEEARPGSARMDGHDVFFTVGENVGRESCSIPSAGVEWRPLPPPVTLDDWPVTTTGRSDRFTTVSTWRSPLGSLSFGDVTFSGKHHQWRRVIDLPRRSPHEFEIALDIHPGDGADRDALERHGWHVRDPAEVAGALDFRSYVQGSGAEFSVAHGVYVETASGWLSDRTVRYLASGKPALVQDTAAGAETGEGLVTFRTVEEAAAGAASIAGDYERHAQAARAMAEERFDSDRVLERFLDEAGVK